MSGHALPLSPTDGQLIRFSLGRQLINGEFLLSAATRNLHKKAELDGMFQTVRRRFALESRIVFGSRGGARWAAPRLVFLYLEIPVGGFNVGSRRRASSNEVCAEVLSLSRRSDIPRL